MQRGNNFGNRMKNILASGAVSCVAAMGASRHNSPLFFISHLPRWLRTRRFSKPLEKQCFATFLPFRALSSFFFWLFLFSDLLSSSLLFPPLLLHLPIFSEVWLLNFLPEIELCTGPIVSPSFSGRFLTTCGQGPWHGRNTDKNGSTSGQGVLNSCAYCEKQIIDMQRRLEMSGINCFWKLVERVLVDQQTFPNSGLNAVRLQATAQWKCHRRGCHPPWRAMLQACQCL